VVDSTLEVRIGDSDETLWCGIAAASRSLLFVVLNKERRDCTWACKLAVFFALVGWKSSLVQLDRDIKADIGKTRRHDRTRS
jgi:hypothetical protein